MLQMFRHIPKHTPGSTWLVGSVMKCEIAGQLQRLLNSLLVVRKAAKEASSNSRRKKPLRLPLLLKMTLIHLLTILKLMPLLLRP